MKKSQKKQLLNIGFVVLLLVLTIVLILQTNKDLKIESVGAFLSGCNPWLLACAFLSMLAFMFFEALALHLILKRFGHKPKLRASMAYSASDIYYSNITPSATGGQPASAFYMIRDGVSGGASCFALVFNLVCYTAAILIVGAVALISHFGAFLEFSLGVKILIVVGIVMQISLLVFFISCMIFHRAVLRIGNFFIHLLAKIKIVKREEKWLAKMTGVIEKYRDSYEHIKHNKLLMVEVLLCNVIQRAALIFVTVFVCLAATDCSVFDVFCLQALVVLGYNCIPLPGGSGAFEFLYLNIYEHSFASCDFILISMLASRTIAYYGSMIVCGLYTMIYHVSHKHSPEVKVISTPCTSPTEEQSEKGN